MGRMALPIEDYALIGDRHTAALVGRNGSIDWLCLPRFDSPACFAGLLGTDDHGHWQLEPVGDYTSTRRYVDDSTTLETTFTTPTGVVRLLDVMPTGDDRADVVRRLRGIEGTVTIRHEWIVRMDYGHIRPWVTRHMIGKDEVITAVAGPDQLVLRGRRLPDAVDHRHCDEFEVAEGDEMTFSTTWIPSSEPPPGRDRMRKRLKATIKAAAGPVTPAPARRRHHHRPSHLQHREPHRRDPHRRRRQHPVDRPDGGRRSRRDQHLTAAPAGEGEGG